MAVKEEFEIRVSKDGEIRIVARGFSGKECEIPLKELLKKLGVDGKVNIEHTEEWHRITSEVKSKVKGS